MEQQEKPDVLEEEFQPQETNEPEQGLARILDDSESPDEHLALLEKKAELAPRFAKAISTILVNQTYPEDWQIFGEGDKATVNLSSAGAERIMRLFNIKFFEIEKEREEFTDANGTAYRYVFEGKAALGNRLVYAQGAYSTRDKFLGYANSEWRPVEDINENNIRNAAYHIFIGNAVKALLGLRNLPLREFKALIGKADKAGKTSFNAGSQGGTKQNDKEKQKELANICIEIANSGQTVTLEEGKPKKTFATEQEQKLNNIELARRVCINLSSFNGKKGLVKGKPASQLKGKWLNSTLEKARKI